MVTTNGSTVAVAADQDHVHFRLGQLNTGCKGSCTAVSGVQGAAINVAGQTGGTTDTGNDSSLFLLQVEAVHGTDQALHDNTVAATRAPDMGQFARTDKFFVIKSHGYLTSFIFSRICSGLIGSPSTRLMPRI